MPTLIERLQGLAERVLDGPAVRDCLQAQRDLQRAATRGARADALRRFTGALSRIAEEAQRSGDYAHRDEDGRLMSDVLLIEARLAEAVTRAEDGRVTTRADAEEALTLPEGQEFRDTAAMTRSGDATGVLLDLARACADGAPRRALAVRIDALADIAADPVGGQAAEVLAALARQYRA